MNRDSKPRFYRDSEDDQENHERDSSSELTNAQSALIGKLTEAYPSVTPSRIAAIAKQSRYFEHVVRRNLDTLVASRKQIVGGRESRGGRGRGRKKSHEYQPKRPAEQTKFVPKAETQESGQARAAPEQKHLPKESDEENSSDVAAINHTRGGHNLPANDHEKELEMAIKELKTMTEIQQSRIEQLEKKLSSLEKQAHAKNSHNEQSQKSFCVIPLEIGMQILSAETLSTAPKGPIEKLIKQIPQTQSI